LAFLFSFFEVETGEDSVGEGGRCRDKHGVLQGATQLIPYVLNARLQIAWI
jgi:hypothetical protein